MWIRHGVKEKHELCCSGRWCIWPLSGDAERSCLHTKGFLDKSSPLAGSAVSEVRVVSRWGPRGSRRMDPSSRIKVRKESPFEMKTNEYNMHWMIFTCTELICPGNSSLHYRNKP